MRCPLFLPEEMKYCEGAVSPEQLIQLLLQHSVAHLITFFCCGCEDETWTSSVGGSYMEALLEWLNTQAYNQTISTDHLKQAAKFAQEHYHSLKPYYKNDITFEINGDTFKTSSFILSGGSHFFREIIRRKGAEKLTHTIRLSGVDHKRFLQFEEFCYAGKIEQLWREEPEEILSLIMQATKWGVDSLAAFAASIYSRYIDHDNVISLFTLSMEVPLPALTIEACRFISEHQYINRVEVVAPGQLKVLINEWTENAEKAFPFLQPYITHLSVREKALEDPRVFLAISHLNKLVYLDLHETSEVSEQILELFPNIEELILSRCSWLTDDLFVKIVEHSPQVLRINLSENSQLTYRSWGALAGLQNLSDLNISRCRNLSDDELDLLASSCPHLISINLAGCNRITDEGIVALVKQCSEMREISLEGCSTITEEGLIAFAAVAPGRLEKLNLKRCGGVTYRSVNQILSLQPRLQKFLY